MTQDTSTGEPFIAGAPDSRDEPGGRIFPPPRWLAEYRAAWLGADIVAGVTLAAYAIPVSLAYAGAQPTGALMIAARAPGAAKQSVPPPRREA